MHGHSVPGQLALWCAVACAGFAAPTLVRAQPAFAAETAAATGTDVANAGASRPTPSVAERIAALETLASGALPSVPIEQVLDVSLDDDSSMVARDDELRRARRDLLVAVRQARRLKSKTEAELAEMDTEIIAMDLERKVLALPIEVRERLVALEGEVGESGRQDADASAGRTATTEPPRASAASGEARTTKHEATPPSGRMPVAEQARDASFGPLARWGWAVALLAALWLLRRSTSAIFDAYVALHPNSALAAWVRIHGERWFRFALALVAAIVLAPSTLARWTRRLAGAVGRGDGHMKAALAPRVSAWSSDLPELPKVVLEALTLDPLRGPSPLLVDGFAGLDEFCDRFEAWRSRARPHATLVVGKAGSGKTTWLHAAARAAGGVPVSHLALRNRETSPASVRLALARAVGLSDEVASSVETLTQALVAGPRRLVCIDDLQQWFLRRPGGLEGLQELERLIVASGSHISWLGSISHYTYALIRWAARSSTAFGHVVCLPAWSEASIAELLSRRTAQAGLSVTYEAVSLAARERSGSAREVLGTARDYALAICELADGCPRAALNLWRASLTRQADGTLRARLARAPDASQLDALSEVGRFALSGMAWHGRVGIDDLSESLRVTRDAVRIELEALRGQGVVLDDGDQLSVSAPWWPTVARFLERARLIGG